MRHTVLVECGQRAKVLRGERPIRADREIKLGIGDQLAITVQGGQLIRLQLSESVERLNPGELINTKKLYIAGILIPEACENMCEHGLIEKACIKPQDNMLVEGCDIVSVARYRH